MIMRFVKGVAALLVSGALLAGIPAALVFFAGNPIPSWGGLVEALSRPDYNGAFLMGTVLPLIAWIAWFTFAVGFILEVPNQLPSRSSGGTRRQRRRVRVAGFGVQQKAAGVLIGAIVAIGAPAGALAAESPEAPVAVTQQAVAEAAPTEVAEAAPTSETPEERVTFTDRTVQSGDTLWSIAEDELGSGDRFGEIVEATVDVVQPGGRQLTDPNLILPGWTVKIPHITAVAAPDTGGAGGERDEAPVESVPAEGDESGSGAAGAEEGAGQAAPPIEDAGEPAGKASGAADLVKDPVVDAEASDWGVFNPATLGGIGGLLAAGLLGLLGWRRVMQRRRRKPGQKMALPADPSTLELEMRAVEDSGGQEHLDKVLRHFALWAQEQSGQVATPTMVRIDVDDVSLYFTDGAVESLPEPFTKASEDGLVWSMARAEVPELMDIPSAPLPALVAIGRDENDGTIYVDLERVGALNIASDHLELREGALTALSLELAVNAWSEDVRVLVVGSNVDLPVSLGTGRIEMVEDADTLLRNLRVQADAADQVLMELGADSPQQARLSHTAADGWAPEIIVLAEPLPDEQQSELAGLVSRIPRVGIAAISNGYLAGDWNFTLTSEDEADLSVPAWGVSIPVIPQLVNAEEAGQLRAMFATSAEDDCTVEDAPAEILLDRIPPATTGDTDDADVDAGGVPVEAVTEEPTLAGDEDESVDVEQALAEEAPEPLLEKLLDDEPAPEMSEPAVEPAATLSILEGLNEGPVLRMFGTPEITGARGSLPMDEKNAKTSRHAMKYGTELAAFLSITNGASAQEISEAMWPGQVASGNSANARRNGLVSKLRRWLGTNDDGEEYLPRKVDAYRIHIATDWQVFCELVGDDIYNAPTDNLIAALELVKGQPLSGVDDRRYVWADTLRQTMICQIGDVAHELATRSLENGDVRRARMASAVGRMVDPITEVYWRDSLRAEFQAGDTAGIERLITQLEQHLADIDEGYEPDPETQALIDQLRGRYAEAA